MLGASSSFDSPSNSRSEQGRAAKRARLADSDACDAGGSACEEAADSPGAKSGGVELEENGEVGVGDSKMDRGKKRTNSVLSYFSKPANSSSASGSSSSIPSTSTPKHNNEPTATPKDTLSLERTTMSPDWFSALLPELQKPYFKSIQTFLAQDSASHKIYPPDHLRYSFTKCPLDNIKVVVLGQDPYHGPGQAHGLAFSVQKGVAVPPSLGNMFTELEREFAAEGKKFRRPGHGCLEGWVGQGVLLLNASLTVRASTPNSHSTIGWERFTDAIIDHINTRLSGVVFLLWGAFAGKKGGRIDKKKHLILTSPHPSPLSAHRGFIGNNHFKLANAYLEKQGKGTIDWSYLP